MLQIVAPNEVVVAVVYQVQMGEVKGTMSICLPVVMLESVIDKFNHVSYSKIKHLRRRQPLIYSKLFQPRNFLLPLNSENSKLLFRIY